MLCSVAHFVRKYLKERVDLGSRVIHTIDNLNPFVKRCCQMMCRTIKIFLLDQGMRRVSSGILWDLVRCHIHRYRKWWLLVPFRNVTLDEVGCFLLSRFLK